MNHSSHKVLVQVSARHIHLTQESVDTLFGKGTSLSVKRPLSNVTQFLSNETLDIVGPKNTIHNVSILGPCRDQNQIEISLTDARTLGIDTPIRLSGDLDGSAAIELIGPKGSLKLKSGLVVAKRHIHMNTDTAELLGLKQGDSISVVTDEKDRALVFRDVIVRVSEDSIDIVHIDTDEGNAASIKGSAMASIII